MRTSDQSLRENRAGGFTLVEILVSLALVLLLLIVLVSMVDSTRHVWTYTSAKIEQFRESREGFESITRRLSQATLNTYWDYQRDANGNPTSYIRQSELRFISGPSIAGDSSSAPPRPTHSIFFQAPLGQSDIDNYTTLVKMLNTVGYFIEFTSDEDFRPQIINAAQPNRHHYRYRLMEMIEPSESLTIYNAESAAGGNSTYTGIDWFTTALGTTNRPVRVLADNVVALVLLPKLAPEEDSTGIKLAPQYLYDSTQKKAQASINPKNQLPPVIQVTMVAIDEDSAARLAAKFGETMPDLGLRDLFKTAEDFTQDLQTLQNTLVAQRINYRIFTTDVAIRAAKWSREQSN